MTVAIHRRSHQREGRRAENHGPLEAEFANNRASEKSHNSTYRVGTSIGSVCRVGSSQTTTAKVSARIAD